MAETFNSSRNVVGMSLRNELRGPKQNLVDWYRYMQMGAEAVHLVNPNVLVILSGLDYDKVLTFLSVKQVELTFEGKLVFELHWYGFSDGGDWKNGLCVLQSRSNGEPVLGSCGEYQAWSYTSELNLVLKDAGLCLQAGADGEEVKFGTQCKNLGSKWVQITDSRMLLSTYAEDNGHMVCLDLGPENSIITSTCKCLVEEGPCSSESQWFKIVDSNRESSSYHLQLRTTDEIGREAIRRAMKALRKRHLLEEGAHAPAIAALSRPFAAQHSAGIRGKEKAEKLEFELQQCYRAQSRLSEQLVVEVAECRSSKALVQEKESLITSLQSEVTQAREENSQLKECLDEKTEALVLVLTENHSLQLQMKDVM
ncbi:hypothetical protein HPP92_021406 [Vanilla planifolia]|uniref:Glycoside hydrolase family 5 domain-containing protein n=1 Tax=Vanilla planifolia TaxID=51239 RepID=A0A835UFH4_VANPL|nr:hypothetical protein HPP92_021406 [Vanilla planifolia]